MIAALLLIAAAWQSPADLARVAWVPNPRSANGTWVSDHGNHLSAAARDSINAIIGALERETTAEIAVAIVDSLSGMDPQLFALSLHRAWGVGKAGRDNGIVLLWAPTERETYVSVGTGLEGVLPDGRTGRLLDRHLIPAFRAQRWDAGMIAMVRALSDAAREEPAPREGPRTGGRSAPSPLVLVLGGVGLVGALIGGARWYARWRRRRPRPCPKCGTMMALLPEESEDAQLDDAAELEESLKSVDWDVWLCPSCHHAERIPYDRSSKYSRCRHCNRRTAYAKRSETVRPATTLTTGLVRTTYDCKHCHQEWTGEKVLPVIVPASSSSSGSSGGGGSSFGGGSARGGGAGRGY